VAWSEFRRHTGRLPVAIHSGRAAAAGRTEGGVFLQKNLLTQKRS
jgi:hypothetical protein